MIYLTRLDNSEILLNALLIERIESTPDTVVTLTTGKKVVVREAPDEVVRRSIEYLRSLREAEAGSPEAEADRSSVINIAQLGRVTR